MIKLIKYIIAWFRIPKGDYCYFGRRIESKRCPYYREFWYGDSWYEHISYCKYLDESEDSLLYDQCKVCKIKEEDEY